MKRWLMVGALAAGTVGCAMAFAQTRKPEQAREAPQSEARGGAMPSASYAPIRETEPFDQTFQRMSKQRAQLKSRARSLLETRYDLSNRPVQGVTMSRGKAVQSGVRVKLPSGMTWEKLGAMSPEEIRKQKAWPAGFLPLPHPHQDEGGMVFPQFHIDLVKKQSQRDLERFDLDFDVPDHLLPEFPPAIFLTTRPDLGDVSRGQLVTLENFYEMFLGILNPKQIEGLRLLVTPFPQQQFNGTWDRRSARASQGVTCFDCHANGHTNASTHLVGDIRPQSHRRRIDTPTLRGVNVQRLFGSQRALKTVEDFTEFEQRAAYFDGDHLTAAKKGVNVLERGSEVHFMSEFQALLDFPPAPKLNVMGRLDRARATEQELRGEALFNGKALCGTCHPAPHYTDNTMHNLKLERFFDLQMFNGRATTGDGPIKSFPLRGIKDSPPYLHDGRLLTLEDTVEFFNLVLQTQLSTQEKADIVAFMRVL
jgi:cytochrome c peroxidase